MLPIIFLAGAVIVGAGLVAAFWRSAVDWLKRAAAKLQEIIKKTVVGVKIFVKKMKEGFREISKHYSKNGTIWQEDIFQRTCSPDEVPADIRERAAIYDKELDVTHELELQLSH